MSRIFISYRRADSIIVTGRIYDRLVQAFGKNAIFKDLENIGAGVDFRDVLRDAASECRVMLVIIGPNWANAADSKGNLRLHDPNDFVRLEVEMGLQRDSVLVVPVLVNNAPAPTAQELPESLQDIAFNNARPVRNDPDFHPDMDRLIDELKGPLRMTPRSAQGRRTRGIFPALLVAFVIVAIALAAYLASQTPNAGSGSGTPTGPAVALAVETAEATQELPAATPSQAPSSTPTKEPTVVPTEAPTTVPPLAPEDIAATPITQNVDWAFVERDFDGVTMVLVPAGCFIMGNEEGFADEKPAHEQCFDAPFWIDKFEVTNAQFATLEGEAARASFATDANRPRENITWAEAMDFCALRGARLPTEREWEYAASGPSNLNFPWGEGLDSSKFVWSANSNNHSADVGNRPEGQSWVGAQDMTGNVWEWTSSIYKPYPYVATDGREEKSPNADHVLRSGGWDNNFDGDFTTSARVSTSDGPRPIVIGFRCARSA